MFDFVFSLLSQSSLLINANFQELNEHTQLVSSNGTRN